jgi:hypothetical protein
MKIAEFFFIIELSKGFFGRRNWSWTRVSASALPAGGCSREQHNITTRARFPIRVSEASMWNSNARSYDL